MNKQTALIRTPPQKIPDIYIINGPTGSGKSYGANVKWYEILCRAVQGDAYILAGNTSESVYKNVISDMLRFDMGINAIHFTRSPSAIVTHRGAICYVVGVNNEGGERRLKGGSVKGAYMDEVTTFPRSAFDQIMARCRWVTDGKLIATKSIMTCNADSPNHWLKTDYIDRPESGAVVEYYSFWDNPKMGQEYIDALRRKFSGVFFERMVMNRWCIAEGAIYDRFDPAVHIIDVDRSIMRDYIVGVDYGYDHPLAMVLIGIDADGTMYVCDEISVRGQLIDDSLVAKVRHWLQYPVSYAYPPPERPDYNVLMQRLFPQWSIQVAHNDVHEGIQAVQQRLTERPNGKRGLYFDKSCKALIGQMQTYHWRKVKDMSKDEPEKIDDDSCDSLRYGIFTYDRARARVITGNPFKLTR